MVATKVIELRYCDVCGSEDDVQTVGLDIDGASYEVDLCAKHRASVADLAAKGRPRSARRSTAVRKSQRAPRKRAGTDVFQPFDFDPGK